MQFALAQHSTSKPIPVIAGAIITVSPSAGATALVEYTPDTQANISSGAATWTAWSAGQVSATTQDTCASATTLRVTATGGMVYVDVNDTLGSSSGTSGSTTAKYAPHISQYDRALIFSPPPRQTNAVKGFSRNINDAQYVGAISDSDVYDTEAGSLSVGQSTSKALAFHWGKMSWDLGAGESLLIQMRVKTVGATAAVQLFGNYNSTDSGISIALYEPTNATWPGFPVVNYKAQSAAAQAITVPAAFVGASSVTTPAIATDTWVNFTLHVDGASRLLFFYTNGQPHLNAGVSKLNAGSSLQTAGSKRNFGLGHAPTDDSFTTTTAKACRFQALRMAVLPAGLRFANPAYLDWRFNNNPRVLFSDADYLGNV